MTDPATSSRRIEPWLLWTIVGTAIAVVVAVVLILGSAPQTSAHADDVAPGLDRRTATLLEYDPLTDVSVTAPSFRLTDQSGSPMTLADFRGEPVVLSFNDDQCDDLCTLLAEDVQVADRDLGRAKAKIAFVSINANPYYPASATVAQWDDQHGLGHLSNWHFGTSDPATLVALAKSYGVPIGLDAKDRTVTHGAEIFFIDAAGKERAIGQFGTESADTALFGHAMAQAADDLLPASERTTVAGSGVPAPTSDGAPVGATPAPVSVPSLSGQGTVGTKADRGKYTVVDFWSSTCTACIRGIPAMESEYRAVGSQVDFVGVDVSDLAGSGRSFATRYGATFPLGSDRRGSTAGRFAVTGLPYTVILSPTGEVLVRHPGAFTTEQLDYLLRTLDAALPAAS